MAKILVTGGAGFIGSNLTEKLVKLGHSVTVIDNLSHGSLDNLAGVKGQIEFINGDLLNADILESCLAGKDYALHLAANSSVNASLEKPAWSASQNILATVQLLELCAKHKIKRVVLSSSAAVYGYQKELPVKESVHIVPASPYALEKITGENYMKLFSSLSDIDTVCLRYFNVFGPRQNADLPHPGGVTIVVEQLYRKGKSQLMGDGRQTRDMIYVDNVVNANILAMQKKERCGGSVYNIATGSSIVVADMHAKIAELMGVPPGKEFIPLPEGNILDSLADKTLAEKDLGFSIEVGYEEGLKRTIDWCYRQNGWN